MFEWTFRSGLFSCFNFYIVPNYIRNHHTKFEIDRTIPLKLTGMTTTIIALPNKSDRKTIINKYRVTANIISEAS